MSTPNARDFRAHYRPPNIDDLVQRVRKLGTDGTTIGDFRALADSLVATTSPQHWLGMVMQLVHELDLERARPLAQDVERLLKQVDGDHLDLKDFETALVSSAAVATKASETCQALRAELAKARETVRTLHEELASVKASLRDRQRSLDALRARISNGHTDVLGIAGSATYERSGTIRKMVEYVNHVTTYQQQHPSRVQSINLFRYKPGLEHAVPEMLTSWSNTDGERTPEALAAQIVCAARRLTKHNDVGDYYVTESLRGERMMFTVAGYRDDGIDALGYVVANGTRDSLAARIRMFPSWSASLRLQVGSDVTSASRLTIRTWIQTVRTGDAAELIANEVVREAVVWAMNHRGADEFAFHLVGSDGDGHLTDHHRFLVVNKDPKEMVGC